MQKAAAEQLSLASVYSMQSESYFGWTDATQNLEDMQDADRPSGEETGADPGGSRSRLVSSTVVPADEGDESNTIRFYDSRPDTPGSESVGSFQESFIRDRSGQRILPGSRSKSRPSTAAESEPDLPTRRIHTADSTRRRRR